MTDQAQQQNFRTSALKNYLEKVFLTCQALETGCYQGVNTGAHSGVLPHGSASMCSLQPFPLTRGHYWRRASCPFIPGMFSFHALDTGTILDLPFIIWLEFIRGLMTN